MSSYLQSNQPYQRVDDGLLNGAIFGALGVGAAGRGLSEYANYKGAVKKHGSLEASNEKMLASLGDEPTYKEAFKTVNSHTNENIAALDDKGMGKAAKTALGSGKRRMAAAGVSMLAGAALGAGADSLF